MKQTKQDCFLIIEDQASMAQLLKSELEQQTDQPIYICHSMAEAQDLLDTNIDVAVCLSDLTLPDSPDGEVIQLLKKHHITTVVITGTFKEETRERMFKEKVADYVIKDNLSSIRYATQIAYQLYKNHQRTVWLLSPPNSKHSSKLLGMLRIHRFNVSLYDSAQEMLDDLKHKKPSLILLDSAEDLGGNDSIEFIKTIRNNCSQNQLPIISCEDSANITSAIKLMKYGVNDFFNTNFTPEEFYVRVNQNIEQSETFTAIERISQTDGLTGLYNRRYFFERGEMQFAELQQQGKYFFTLMADIDHFKNVNDTHGHQKGDDAIRYTANTIQSVFKDHLVARFGGEEFCVFGEVEDTSEVEDLAEELRRIIEAESKKETEVPFTISLGMTYSGENLDKAIAKADAALYQSKENGRNQVSTEF